MPSVIVVGELEEDQAEDRNGVFARLKIGIGAQFVGGCPQVFFELFELFFRHSVSLPITPALKATHSTRFVERTQRDALPPKQARGFRSHCRNVPEGKSTDNREVRYLSRHYERITPDRSGAHEDERFGG